MITIQLGSPSALALALAAAPLFATLIPKADDDSIGSADDDGMVTGTSMPGEREAA